MCSDKKCILQQNDEIALAGLCANLSEEGEIDLLASILPPALIIFDVCATLGLDATRVLGIRMLMRIKAYEACRPWPVLSEAEDAEMIDLDNDTRTLKNDWKSGLSDQDISEMFSRE